LKKPKVVFVASDPPMPPTGGGNRTFHFVRAVAEVSCCHLFVLFPIDKAKLPPVILDSCATIVTSTIRFTSSAQNKLAIFLYYIRLLFFPWSFSKRQIILTADYYVTATITNKSPSNRFFYKVVKHTLAEYALFLYRLGYNFPVKTLERYDQSQEIMPDILRELKRANTLWIDFSSLLPFFTSIRYSMPELTVICNAHNIEYKYLERLNATAKTQLEKRWYQRQALAMKRTELEGFEKCDLVITCSEIDKKEILKYLPNVNIEVIPNGVDTEYFTPVSCLTHTPSLLFTGTMNYRANKDAVAYFIDSIFPLILKDFPECIFKIAGAGAKQAFKDFVGMKGLEIISDPEDMRPLYNGSWIVVVPLRSGSGTRLKILEAMAMEKPVVSTKVGAEGLDMKNGEHLYIVPDEIMFAEKVVNLLQDQQLRTKLSILGKERVNKYYSWKEIIIKAKETTINQL
jgi:polysaccharide biosynthesis protein PslH